MSKIDFRPQYRELTDQEKAHIGRIKAHAQTLLNEIHPAGNRELSLAITKLEECVMWAVKGLTE